MGEKELSSAEAELYDRQIRLWGIESQEKLRAANVLLVGMRGLGSEIAKDILLSGINSLTILDDGVVTEEELSKNFLLSQDSLGKKIVEAVLLKAQALNPLVKIIVDTEPLADKPEEYFRDFTIVVASGLKSKVIVALDLMCRKFNVQFIYGDVFGLFGYSISDFQEHNYYEDKVKLPQKQKRTHDGKPTKDSTPTESVTIKVERKADYPPLDKVLPTSEKRILKPGVLKRKRRNDMYYLMRLLLQFRDQNDRDPAYDTKTEDLKKLEELREEILQKYPVDAEKLKEDVLHLVFGVTSPICAIMGGIMAQEVIKAVSHKEVPIHNMFLLNPYTFGGKEDLVGLSVR